MKTQQVRTIYTFSLVILDAVMIVLAFLLAYWLLNSEAGARFAWRQAEAAAGARLSAERVSGTLSGGLEIRGLSFRDESLELDAAAVTFAVAGRPAST